MGFICTTSNAEAGTCESVCRSSLSQRSSGAPLRYMELPLSAMIIPYLFNAVRITCTFFEKEEISKLAFRRRRIPIGAARELVELAAQCDAGGTTAARLSLRVKRKACGIFPA